MDNKLSVEMPGVEYVVDGRGQKTAVLINLKKHGPLWEDVYDAYLLQRWRKEPRESLARVKHLLARVHKRGVRA